MKILMPILASLRLACAAMLFLGCSSDDKYDAGDYAPTGSGGQQPLQLSIESGTSNLVADGVQTLTLVAQIAPANASSKMLNFSVTKGTLSGGGKQGSTLDSIPTDSRGQATITLTATETGSSTVTVWIPGVKPLPIDSQDITLVPAPDTTLSFIAPALEAEVGEVVRFALSQPADGATLTQISLRLAAGVPAGTAVTLQTSVGEFAGATATDKTKVTVTPAADNVAVASLKSPSVPATAQIAATVGSVTRRATLDFVRAYPETITLAAPLEGKVGEALTVKALLSRAIGSIARDTPVTFQAIGEEGAALDLFGPGNTKLLPTTGAAEVSVTFTPEASGQIEITAQTPGPDDGLVSSAPASIRILAAGPEPQIVLTGPSAGIIHHVVELQAVITPAGAVAAGSLVTFSAEGLDLFSKAQRTKPLVEGSNVVGTTFTPGTTAILTLRAGVAGADGDIVSEPYIIEIEPLVLDLEPTTDSLVADGLHQLDITASLSTNEPGRTIKFSTDEGELRGGGTTAAEVTVVTDGFGQATVELTAVHEGTAAVKAWLQDAPAINAETKITLTRPAADALITFVEPAVDTAAGGSIPQLTGAPLADANTATPVVVELDPVFPTTQSVIFRLSEGSFAPADVGGTGKTSTTAIDPDGRAVAVVKSPAEPTTAVLSVTAGTAVRRVRLVFAPALAQQIELAGPSQGVVDAPATLTATLSRLSGVPSGGEVRFSAADADGNPAEGLSDSMTTAFALAAGEAPIAAVEFTPPAAGTYVIVAETGGNAGKVTSMPFEIEVPPPPLALALVAAPMVARVGEAVTLTATFTRSGTAIQGAEVTFSAVDGEGNALDLFAGTEMQQTNETGNASAEFTSDQVATISVTATATDGAGNEGTASVTVLVQE